MVTQMLGQARAFLFRIGVSQERGQGLIEYGLIVLLIAVVVIVTLAAVGGQLGQMYQAIFDALP